MIFTRLKLSILLLFSWIGTYNCQDDCLNYKCQNFSYCALINGVPTCTCIPGFTGSDCDVNIDVCFEDPNPCLNDGNCTDLINGFECDCPPGYTGRQCQTNINECENDPCINGVCLDGINAYECICNVGYTGENCEVNIDNCLPNPCQYGGTCVDGVDEYTCVCPSDYGGSNCELKQQCPEEEKLQCQNNGVCVLSGGVASCNCTEGYTGELCSEEIDECQSSPCLNGATCLDKIADFQCTCSAGFTGNSCETDIDECEDNPCENGGECEEYVGGFDCFCQPGFNGILCQINIDDCVDVSCQNGGACVDGIEVYTCMCQPGYTGDLCETLIDPCASSPCNNSGTCNSTDIEEYSCTCPVGFTGKTCEIEVLPCSSNPCKNNATCENVGDSYRCFCLFGFTDEECDSEIDECLVDPCLNGGTCIDQLNGYQCVCPDGFTDTDCGVNIDDCMPNPCENNATCVDGVNQYTCQCIAGFTGSDCSVDIDECASSPCHSMATCIDLIDDYRCLCSLGLTGPNCLTNINDCSDNPCENGGTCVDMLGGYMCICQPGFTSDHCAINIDDCFLGACENNGSCIDGVDSYSCECQAGYTGDNCEEIIDNCQANACQNGATCLNLINDYECICPLGYTGNACSILIDHCETNLCKNGATCVGQVGGFECLCTMGYTGNFCEEDIDDCLINPCGNNGTCIDGVDSYSCECQAGYTGDNCEEIINNCQANACQNGATCLNLINDYECICPLGYTGDACSILIDHCETNLCKNGATCVGQVGGFECLCTMGYTGNFCEEDIDDCLINPCGNNGTCIDSIDGYTCVCDASFTGDHCDVEVDLCSNVVCQNGGKCSSELNGKCLCLNGYTGPLCEVDIDECSKNPCLNNGICIDGIGNFTCECQTGYSGSKCEVDLDLCDPIPCLNNGTCVQNENYGYFNCSCEPGYEGLFCEADINECDTITCSNDGTCINNVGSFSCVCKDFYIGQFCDYFLLPECPQDYCFNNGTCSVESEDGGSGSGLGITYTCNCPPDFTGPQCEMNLDPCSLNPCKNNASCESGPMGTYSCYCAQGFTGPTCDTLADDCAGEPCLNGGTCVDMLLGYSCNCPMGFTGPNCETEIDPCSLNPCKNEGTCVNNDEQLCVCAPGYTGKFCDTELDFCIGFPCKNDATCINGLTEYTCICPDPFTGNDCEILITPCTDVLCQNGGSCEVLGDDYKCDCPLGFYGKNCSEEYKGNNTFPTFSGDSYTCVNAAKANFNLTFSLKSETEIGLLAYANTTDGYLFIGINESYLIMEFKQGENNSSAKCEMNVTDGMWHTIKLYQLPLNQETLVLSIDGNLTKVITTKMNTFINLTSYLCFGDIPDDKKLLREKIDGYIGSLNSSISLNGESLDILKDSVEAENIGPPDDPCFPHNPCLHNGICTNSEDYSSYNCACTEKYTGNDCEILITPCTDVLCQNGGSCEVLGDDYKCDCPLGFYGKNCSEEYKANNTFPTFSGDSYTCVNAARANFNLTFSLKSETEIGLLVYVNTTDGYLFIGINGGYLTVELKQGENVNLELTEMNIADGMLHTITLIQIPQNEETLILSIDGEQTIVYIDNTFIELIDYLCFGDIPDDKKLLREKIDGYIGSLNSSISLNGKSLDILKDSVEAENIGPPDDPCFPHNPCLHNGTCTNNEDYFSYNCACTEKYTGNDCEILITPCTDVLCQNGGSCEVLGDDYKCDCPLGFYGKNCSEEYKGNNTFPTFSGDSYTCVNTAEANFSLTFSLKSETEIGLLVYANTTDGYLFIGINGGDLIVELKQGENDPSKLTEMNIADGMCHTITLFQIPQNKYTLVLLIDEKQETVGIKDMSIELMDYLCFGDIPDEKKLLREKIDGYIGSLNSSISLNGESLDILEDSVEAENIGPPDGPCSACTDVLCQNGGSCEVVQDDYKCDCPLGFYGKTCSEETSVNSTVPTFSGDSYSCVNTTTKDNFDLMFSFKSEHGNGLLAYANTTNGSLSISIADGLVLVDLKHSGNFITFNISERNFTSGIWHRVSLKLVPDDEYLLLTVDDMQTEGKFSGYIELADNLCFGDIPDDKQLRGRVIGGYIGSLGSSITLNEQSVDILKDSVEAENIGPPDGSACNPDSCSSKGDCLEDELSDNGFVCRCYLGYTGKTCEEDIDIVIPLFSGKSWMNLYLSPKILVNNSLEVVVSISTHSPNGLIFLLADSKGKFLTLGLISGQIVIQYDLGAGSAAHYLQVNISDGQWHMLLLHHYGDGGSLTVDDAEYQFSANSSKSVFEEFSAYIGMQDPLSLNFVDLIQPNGFQGSIIEFQINGIENDLTGNEKNIGRNIGQSPLSLCSYVMCENQGVCQGINEDPWFSCECPYGYIGEFCETSVPFCTPNPCNGGVCEEFEDRTFQCSCRLGTGGRFCEEELNITIPSFSGESYIEYPKLPNAFDSFTIKLTFNPAQPNGLLLFNSLSKGNFSDYVSLAIINSHIVYRYNLGSGDAEITSVSPVSLNEWHSVTITRLGKAGSLTVDSEDSVNGESPGAFTGLNLGDALWLGGYRQFINISAFTGVDKGLHGSISSLIINNKTVDLVLDAVSGLRVGEYNSSSCEGNPCLNGGTCVTEGGSFVCQCPPSHEGVLCASDVDHCGSSPCLNGGTCLEFANGTGYSCYCPYSYGGEFCNQETPVTSPSFSTLSYLHLNRPSVSIALSTIIEMTFYSSSNNGLLLYIGNVTESVDFIALTLLSGYVQLRYNLGSDTAVITSNMTIALNQWQTVKASRTLKTGLISINGGAGSSETSLGTSSQLNVGGKGVYVGGVEESSVFSEFAGTEMSFTGCIESVKINYLSVELGGSDSIISGRNIKECPVNLCTQLPCMHGGTCVVTGLFYQCICPLNYTGSNCENFISIDTPLFYGQYSYIMYKSLQNVYGIMKLKLSINPNASTGLILYNGQLEGIDYIAILLRNGLVEFHYELGFGPTVITSNSTVSLQSWHVIEVIRNGPMGQLIVDDLVPVVKNGMGTILNLGNDYLYLGGVPDYLALPDELDIKTGFSGCIRQLAVSMSDEPEDLIYSALSGVDIGDCSEVLMCLSDPCHNGATCVDDGFDNTFKCLCTPWFTGVTCDTEVTQCVNNICENGGECFPKLVNDSLMEVCKCSLPFGGDTCSEKVSFSTAEFSNKSYLQFPVEEKIPLDLISIHTVIELTITPTTMDGLILYLGKENPSDGDYLLVGLTNGLVEFRFELGGGEGVVRSTTPVSLEETHSITAIRTDNKGKVGVDGAFSQLSQSPLGEYTLEFDSNDLVLYLGGSPDPSTISRQSFSFGYSGCISDTLQIGYPQNTILVSFNSASTGNSTQTCSLT